MFGSTHKNWRRQPSIRSKTNPPVGWKCTDLGQVVQLWCFTLPPNWGDKLSTVKRMYSLKHQKMKQQTMPLQKGHKKCLVLGAQNIFEKRRVLVISYKLNEAGLRWQIQKIAASSTFYNWVRQQMTHQLNEHLKTEVS